MARITSWSHDQSAPKQHRPNITDAAAHWSTETDASGATSLVIRTFGSNDRQDVGAVSQILHLDSAAAWTLLEILVSVLPALDPPLGHLAVSRGQGPITAPEGNQDG